MRNWGREDAAWDDDPEETPFIENFAVRETDPPDNVAHRLGLLKVEGEDGPRLEDWEDDAEDREEGDGCHLLLMQLPLLPLSVLRPGATADPEGKRLIELCIVCLHAVPFLLKDEGLVCSGSYRTLHSSCPTLPPSLLQPTPPRPAPPRSARCPPAAWASSWS